MDRFLNEIKKRILIYDGSKGYLLQKLGLKGGECGEEWNITKPDTVKQIYRSYKEAGADVIQTNTFTGSRVHLEKYGLGDKVYEINFKGSALAREVMGSDGFVAASVGPSGILFEPSGELTFDKAYDIYREQVIALADGGADIINFETFTDLAEMRAALLAAKENTSLPVICSMAYESNGHTLMGTDPYTASIVLQSLGADLIGTNCSFGAEHMVSIVEQLYEAGGSFLSVKPNAGLPEVVDGKVIYNDTPDKFAGFAEKFAGYGARLIGGCCGTTPEHINALKQKLSGIEPAVVKTAQKDIITSSMKRLSISGAEAINTGRLEAADIDEVLDAALDLSTEGYDAVYVNVDNLSNDPALFAEAVNIAQGYIKEPFVIGTANPCALEKSLRIYKGIAGVVYTGNSNEDKSRAEKIAERYGSVLVDFRKFIV